MTDSELHQTQDRWLPRAGLSVASGILLGFSFPPSPFYTLAYVAFIPLFFLFARLESFYKIAKYSYLFLFVFHLITVYWTGGFVVGKDLWMMTAGAAVIFIHPLFFLPIVVLAFLVKKKLGLIQGLIAFALFWTSFEYLHSLGEYSFPWLSLGNSQAYDLHRIQIVEYSSVYGLTLLIFTFNSIAFLILWNQASGTWKLRSRKILFLVSVLVILYFGSALYGTYAMKKESIDVNNKISVGILQPNFDPWDKWGGSFGDKFESYVRQLNYYFTETQQLSKLKPDMIIWPETAIPFHILLPRYSLYLSELLSLADTLNLPIYTGLPTAEYFDSLHAPATAERIGMSNLYVESYNAGVLIQPHRVIGQIHKKSILVPFAERIPYAESFRFLIEPLKWNVGISSWGKGEDTVVYALRLKDGRQTKFSGMICYESVYPNYVREFVKRGAEFLVIITNDSWWGNTPGAYQHASFASLRAVETRRWVVQCANGGISMVVDPTGKRQVTTDLYTKAQFIADIDLLSKKTFYVAYGDVVAQICLVMSILMLFSAIVKINKSKGN
ncbi:MAG: apolipoprotein N-acyltransferase [Ignavibacteriales bacterium]|nr:apolipoprotein N-acyltransferase [Ignavibacteriales bacterium]